MKKRIDSAYNYLNYRLIINDDFLMRSAANSSYSLRAYSRDLVLSVSFLSAILRGQKHLGLKSGMNLFAKLGFENDEMKYIKSLIIYSTVNDPMEKEAAAEFIRRHHNQVQYDDHPEKIGLLKSVDHFLIFGIVRRVYQPEQIQNIAAQLDISPVRVLEVLMDLIQDGLVEYDGLNYRAQEMNISIKTSAKMMPVMREFSHLLLKMIETNNGIKVPDQVAQCLILGMDQESYLTATEAHKHFIQQLNRLAAGSKKVDRFVFTTSVFFSKMS
jgi:uncharacterized protein (TIGR02147 family)